jgi:hypothetical protein
LVRAMICARSCSAIHEKIAMSSGAHGAAGVEPRLAPIGATNGVFVTFTESPDLGRSRGVFARSVTSSDQPVGSTRDAGNWYGAAAGTEVEHCLVSEAR